MSNGTNKERIEQNNQKLDELKLKIEELPDYQNIKPIYGVGDLKLSYITLPGVSSSSGRRLFKSGKIACVEQNGYVYFFYDNEYICAYKKEVNTGEYGNFVKIADDYCIIMVSAQSVWYRKVEIIKFDWVNKTATQIGTIDISDLGSSAGDTYLPDGTLIMTSGNKVCRYIEETNSFKYYGITMSNTSYNKGVPNILYENYSSHYTNYITIRKLIYNETNDTYTVISGIYPEIVGVNYYGNKVFRYGNVYELNPDLTIGKLLNSNVYTHNTGGVGYTMYCLNSKYYYYYNHSYDGQYPEVPPTILEFNEETNTFSTYGTKSSFLIGTLGDCMVYTHNRDAGIYTFYDWTDTSYEIGFTKDGITFYYESQGDYVTSDKILIGEKGYTSGFQLLLGKMPNNETLTYIPTTSQQIIPKGYTSGGVVEAVTNDIDINIKPENIREGVTILGVTGTYTGPDISL